MNKHGQDPPSAPSDRAAFPQLGSWGSGERRSRPPDCRCLHRRSSFRRKQTGDPTSQALGFQRLAVRQSPRAPPCGAGFPTPPRPRTIPVPLPRTCRPKIAQRPRRPHQGFSFLFCCFQAFFCLSENETDTPPASRPPDNTHAPALMSPCGRPPSRLCPGRAPRGTHSRGRRRAGRALTVPSARRLPRPRPEERPAAAQAAQPARHAPPGSGEALRPRLQRPRAPRAGAARRVLRIRWVPRGAAESPEAASGARHGRCGRGAGAAGGRGAGRRSGPALCPPCLGPGFCSCLCLCASV